MTPTRRPASQESLPDTTPKGGDTLDASLVPSFGITAALIVVIGYLLAAELAAAHAAHDADSTANKRNRRRGMPTRKDKTLTDYGIDVSHGNRVNDWNSVRGNNILYASIKITEPTIMVDPAVWPK